MRSRLPALFVALVVVVAAACGGDDDTGEPDGDTAASVVEDGADPDSSPDDGTAAPTSDAAGSDAAGEGVTATAELVTVSVPQDEGTLTPFTHSSSPPALNLVWDTLLVNDLDNQLHPLVADSFELSEDRLTYTFTIRDGMTWHDGVPFTVDDVVFSFEYRPDTLVSALETVKEVVTRVEAVDADTVEIELTEPNSDFEQNVLASLFMIPEHVFSEVEDPTVAGLEVAVGSGPYRIAEYVPDQRYRLEANEDYVPGTPTVDVIEMPIIPQSSTAFSALRTGEVDLSSVPLETQLVDGFEDEDGVELVRGSFFSPQLMVFNAARAPFDQDDVRVAISRAIDVDELIDVVALGVATPPNAGFLHPESPIVTDTVDHVYDPEEAASLLDGVGAVVGEGGVRVLDGDPLSFSLLVDSIETDSVRAAELIGEMLGEVGIDVSVEPIETQTLYDQVWPEFNTANDGDFDMTMFSWQPVLQTRAGRFGGLVHSDPMRGTLNIGGYADAEADELVEQLDAAPDEQSRLEAVQEVSELIADEQPFVTLYFPDTTFAYRPDAYDGWQYRAGLGPLNTVSLVDYEIF